MDAQKQNQIANAIKEAVARAIQAESNQTSLITVTRVTLSLDAKYATVYVSVMPEDQEQAALDFLKRKRSQLQQAVRKNTRIGRIPFLDVVLDFGEKNRQRIDTLSKEAEE